MNKTSASQRPHEGDRDFVESLARGLEVILSFTRESPEMTLKEVAEKTGLSPATARRSLHTLRKLGYVGMNGKRFLLRAKVLSLGSAFLNSMNIKDVADHFLQEVHEEFHDAVSLAVLNGNHVLYVSHISSMRDNRFRARIGYSLPIYCTSLGHVLLAFSDPKAIETYFDTVSFERYTSRTISSAEELQSALDFVRRNDHAAALEQLEYGVLSVAVPVRSPDGDVLAAVNCSGELSRTNLDTMIETRVPALRKAADRIAAALERHPALLHSIQSGNVDSPSGIGADLALGGTIATP